jgi:hypothetical protein
MRFRGLQVIDIAGHRVANSLRHRSSGTAAELQGNQQGKTRGICIQPADRFLPAHSFPFGNTSTLPWRPRRCAWTSASLMSSIP